MLFADKLSVLTGENTVALISMHRWMGIWYIISVAHHPDTYEKKMPPFLFLPQLCLPKKMQVANYSWYIIICNLHRQLLLKELELIISLNAVLYEKFNNQQSDLVLNVMFLE